VLEICDMRGGYDAVDVLHGVSAIVNTGEAVALLGRNGAGKTTLMRATMGLLPRCHGRTVLSGQELGGEPPYRRSRHGLGYVPQGRDIFPDLTVEENLRLGHLAAGRPVRAPLPEDVLAHFPWLTDRFSQRGGTLSGGQQQMLAIARSVVGEPKVLLLDEPTEGLAPAVIRDLRDLLSQVLAARRMSVLVVEQNVRFALSLARRGYVLEKGRIVSEGSADQLAEEAVVNRHLVI
jgi:urea transport system ATP-binding protein